MLSLYKVTELRVSNYPDPEFAVLGGAGRAEENKKRWMNEVRGENEETRLWSFNNWELFTTSRTLADTKDVCICLLSWKTLIGFIWKVNFWFNLSVSCHYTFQLVRNAHVLYDSYSSRNGVAWSRTFGSRITSSRKACIWRQTDISGITAQLMRFKCMLYKQMAT